MAWKGTEPLAKKINMRQKDFELTSGRQGRTWLKNVRKAVAKRQARKEGLAEMRETVISIDKGDGEWLNRRDVVEIASDRRVAGGLDPLDIKKCVVLWRYREGGTDVAGEFPYYIVVKCVEGMTFYVRNYEE